MFLFQHLLRKSKAPLIFTFNLYSFVFFPLFILHLHSLLNIGQDKFMALKSRSGENLFYNHIIPNRNENKNSQQIHHLANFGSFFIFDQNFSSQISCESGITTYIIYSN